MCGSRRRTLALAAGTLLGAVGCVDRRFVVESNAPAAQIEVDGQPIGLAPADGRREYAGVYTIRASAPGYQTVTEKVRFKARWYDYPPLDLFAEVLYPGRIEDVRRVRIDLPAAQPVNQANLVAAADAIRAQGKALREPRVADTPADRPQARTLTPPPPIDRVGDGSNPILGPTGPTSEAGGQSASPQLNPGTAPGR